SSVASLPMSASRHRCAGSRAAWTWNTSGRRRATCGRSQPCRSLHVRLPMATICPFASRSSTHPASRCSARRSACGCRRAGPEIGLRRRDACQRGVSLLRGSPHRHRHHSPVLRRAQLRLRTVPSGFLAVVRLATHARGHHPAQPRDPADRQPAAGMGVVAVGLLCLLHPAALAATPLGRAVLAGMSAFWIIRIVAQLIWLRVNHPLVHALTVLFAFGALLFAWPLLSG